MNTIVCTGLDGSNPLHFLAALGLLRLAERISPGAKIGWQVAAGGWRPVFVTHLDAAGFTLGIVAWLNALAMTGTVDPALRRRVSALATAIKKARKDTKTLAQQAKAEARREGLTGKARNERLAAATATQDRTIAEQQRDLTALRDEMANALGTGISHYGDVIGVDSGIVRRAGERAVVAFLEATSGGVPCSDDPVLVVGQLPALACDQVASGGRVVPTRFSFGNGAGGQCLLKDFRALATRVTVAYLRATLEGSPERFCLGITGLNWDPAANRPYAMNWGIPEDTPKRTDVAANSLAFVGLGLLTAVPLGTRLVPVGWGPGDGWSWPLWNSPVSEPVVRSLLATAEIVRERPDRTRLRACGVAEVRRSERIDPTGQGRPYFAPSRPA